MDHEARSRDQFVVTKHAIKRLRQRMGLPKRAVMNAIERAYEDGYDSSAFKGSFRASLDLIRANAGPATKIIVHQDFVFLVCETEGRRDRVLTAYHVPPEHRRAARSIS